MKGCSLEEAMLRTAADEGEVIRYFRMTVQILHELLDAAPSREFSQTVKTSLLLVNRGIVNAEEQMQASLEADRDFQAQS
jgi:superfamily II RNA helicase